jgi:hypothetical protein
MRHRLPLILSTTALIVAVFGSTPLGQAAYDAVVPNNSVGTGQLRHNAVTAGKIAPNAIRTGHVLNGSLLEADFKPGQLPAGPQGPKGDKGDKGAKGDKGDPALSGYEIVRTSKDVAANSVVIAVTASCPTGKKVVGGTQGVAGLSGGTGVFFSSQIINTSVNVPGERTYAVIVANTNASVRTVNVLAICARVAE